MRKMQQEVRQLIQVVVVNLVTCYLIRADHPPQTNHVVDIIAVFGGMFVAAIVIILITVYIR
jgi:hypothetical protein